MNASRGLTMLLIGLALGLLFGFLLQLSPTFQPGMALSPSQPTLLSMERLETEHAELRAELSAVRSKLTARQIEASANTGRLEDLQAELERQKHLAGLTPVAGPGTQIILDDSPRRTAPGIDPNTYLIHEYDLRDIVNILWLSGSEAIAINGERLVNTSSIYCVGSTAMVNSRRLSPPYLIQAIGNSRVQQDLLHNPGYLQELKEKQRQQGIRFDIKGVEKMTLPAYDGGFLVLYARPGE